MTRTERKPEFDRDVKKLLKRYRTLEDDLENFIKKVLTNMIILTILITVNPPSLCESMLKFGGSFN